MVFSRFFKTLLGAAALTSLAGAAAAQPQTSASHAILDYDPGEVVLQELRPADAAVLDER
jgi:hypothetical protein